jgi:hypothetical protein
MTELVSTHRQNGNETITITGADLARPCGDQRCPQYGDDSRGFQRASAHTGLSEE